MPNATFNALVSVGIIAPVAALRIISWSDFKSPLVSTHFAIDYRITTAYKSLGNKSILYGHELTLGLKAQFLPIAVLQRSLVSKYTPKYFTEVPYSISTPLNLGSFKNMTLYS